MGKNHENNENIVLRCRRNLTIFVIGWPYGRKKSKKSEDSKSSSYPLLGFSSSRRAAWTISSSLATMGQKFPAIRKCEFVTHFFFDEILVCFGRQALDTLCCWLDKVTRIEGHHGHGTVSCVVSHSQISNHSLSSTSCCVVVLTRLRDFLSLWDAQQANSAQRVDN